MDDLFTLNINLEDETGTDFISLVKNPAMDSHFIAFSKEEEIQFSVNAEKKLITGVVAIPGKIIPRLNNKKVKFTKDGIEKDSIKFFKRSAIKNVNEEHSSLVKDVYVVESWLTGKQDKAYEMFGELPVGTWCITMKVENDEIWNKIKSGELQGFSLEGNFELHPEETPEDKLEKILELLKQNSTF